jgi:hypothetical protein
MHTKETFSGTYARCSRWFTVLYKGMYTKLVVIVNERITVDKSGFIHKINSLHGFEGAGKVLYLRRTVVGQFSACAQEDRFCTSHPVDIQ